MDGLSRFLKRREEICFFPSSFSGVAKRGVAKKRYAFKGEKSETKEKKGVAVVIIILFLFSGKSLRVRPCVFACAERKLVWSRRQKKSAQVSIIHSREEKKRKKAGKRQRVNGMKYFQKLGRRRRRRRKLSLRCFAASAVVFFARKKCKTQNKKRKGNPLPVESKKSRVILFRSVIGGETVVGRGGNKRRPWLNTSRSEKERFFLCLDSCETELFLPVKYIKRENGLIPTLFSLVFFLKKAALVKQWEGKGFFLAFLVGKRGNKMGKKS